MNVAVFDTHAYDRASLEAANARHGLALRFVKPRLGPETAALAEGATAVCAFVNDDLGAPVLEALAARGVRAVALRCAGFDRVDREAAERLGIAVMRVPAYSPHAVAEHAVALLMALDRKTGRAAARVRDGNFSLDGLVGFDLYGKTVGVVGTGRIGAAFARIMRGFGCTVLLADPCPDAALEAEGMIYAPFDELLARADVLSLHAPLSEATRHLMDAAAFARLKPGAILLNTSRGGLVDAEALVEALKAGRLGGAGLDVYEREAGVFFADHSDTGLMADCLARLLSFPNVVLTGHQAFLTREALDAIAETTLANLEAWEAGSPRNLVPALAPAPPRP